MPIQYNMTVKNQRLQVVVDNAGPNAVLEIGTAGMGVVLATIPLSNPIGTITNGVLTFSGTPISDTSADATGVAASARVRTASGGITVIDGLTVGTSLADVIMDTVNISVNQTVTINSAIIIHG
jgi:hypothetical protein